MGIYSLKRKNKRGKKEMVTLKVKKSQFLKTLQALNKAVKNLTRNNKNVTCEITITEGKATFAVPGAIFFMECETKGTCKVSMSFPYLFEVIKGHNKKEADITITEDNMQLGIVSFAVKTSFFETDRILRTIDLPMNYTDADLLRLAKESYTMEELQFNKIAVPILKAEEAFERNIAFAYNKLKGYGVTKEDVEKLAEVKIYGERT